MRRGILIMLVGMVVIIFAVLSVVSSVDSTEDEASYLSDGSTATEQPTEIVLTGAE